MNLLHLAAKDCPYKIIFFKSKGKLAKYPQTLNITFSNSSLFYNNTPFLLSALKS